MHRLEECASIGGVYFWSDAVAEVEHLTAAMAVRGKDAPDFSADCCRVGIEHTRVHVALQRDLVANTGASAADIARPVQAQSLGAGRGHRLQPQTATLGKQNYRYTAAIVLTNQAVDNLLHIGQRELLVSRRRQRAAPRVENLHRLRARFDLPVEVGGN